MWKPTEVELQRVRMAAVFGANLVCHDRQIVEDAAELAVEAYELARIAGRILVRTDGWVRAVAANNARDLIGRAPKGLPVDPAILHAIVDARKAWERDGEVSEDGGDLDAIRLELLCLLGMGGSRLTKSQVVAIGLVAEGHSFHSGARAMGADRSNFRRMVHRGVAKLRRWRNGFSR